MAIIRGGGREGPRLVNHTIYSGRSTLRFVGKKVVDRQGREVKTRPLVQRKEQRVMSRLSWWRCALALLGCAGRPVRERK